MASPRRNQPAPTHKPRKQRAATADPADEEWLTVPEIIKNLKIDRRTWQHWVSRGETPPLHRLPSGRYRVRRDDYQAWLAGLRVDA
ncbi:helix-turn-helix transcriptional regulator [Nonomuraea typhae]|uniref:Helix-turn-helix transcriptional regulator n=1 Tax=Nonomuraea typhae TaxID=2603600 RepID=A0ABW7YS07_9ACTN